MGEENKHGPKKYDLSAPLMQMPGNRTVKKEDGTTKAIHDTLIDILWMPAQKDAIKNGILAERIRDQPSNEVELWARDIDTITNACDNCAVAWWIIPILRVINPDKLKE